MVTLWRMITFGVQNFWRNIWLSLITVLILTLNLFLITLVFGLNVVGEQTLAAAKRNVSLSVYFTAETTEQQADEIRRTLIDRPDITSIRVVTREERLERLQSGSGQADVIEDALDALGENPLGPGLEIKAADLAAYDRIHQYLQEPTIADAIDDPGNEFEENQKAIARLDRIVGQIQRATFWLTLVFGLIAVLMVFNTIRVAIYSHREEIGIMKLVGASDPFVRAPFVVTSLVYGVLAAVITLLLVAPLVSILNPSLRQFFGIYDVNLSSYLQGHTWQLIGLELGLGCGLSALSSMFAIGRYLRV